MTWQCPACSTSIRLGDLEELPMSAKVYRCAVCRLELVIDETTNRLTVAPMPPDQPNLVVGRSVNVPADASESDFFVPDVGRATPLLHVDKIR